MKKILISGAGGMVGKTVIKELLNQKNDIEIWASDINTSFWTEKHNNLHIICVNELDFVMSTNQFDVMLQMAFPRNVSPEQWSDGIEFAIDMLFKAKKYNVKRVINVSSQSIYGLQRCEPADINTHVSLFSPYTTGKFCTEVVMKNLFQDGFYTNVRLSTIISPTTSERVINKFFSQIVSGNNLTVQGGHQVFSFLDVRDAACGFVKLILNENEKWKPVYNLGTNENKELLEIANMAVSIANKFGYNSKVILEKADIVLNNRIDVSLFEKDFGWKARYSLEDSMKYIFETTYDKE